MYVVEDTRWFDERFEVKLGCWLEVTENKKKKEKGKNSDKGGYFTVKSTADVARSKVTLRRLF